MQSILLLETGEILYGESIGTIGLTCGELIFNTGMTGYQEILTDPSYKNQIINFTCPHIGNVGVNIEDFESKRVWAAGIAIRELSAYPSNWQTEDTLQNFLHKHKVVGIQGIDTRYLTKQIRERGRLNVAIMSGEINVKHAQGVLSRFSGIKGAYLINNVGRKRAVQIKNKQAKYHIVIIDFGIKNSTLNLLQSLECSLTLLPWNSSIEDIEAYKPDGVLLSNGPGDPATCVSEVAMIKKLTRIGIPIFGICLGFQLLALAFGARTQKMLFGHHGINHPVQDIETKQIMITSQNHVFTVIEDSLPSTILPTHYSLFDGSLQGFKHKHLPIYAFQGHPEAGPGPCDAKKLLQKFISSIGAYNNK